MKVELSKQDLMDLRYAIRYAILSDEESIQGVIQPLTDIDKEMIEQWKSNLVRFKRLDDKIRKLLRA